MPELTPRETAAILLMLLDEADAAAIVARLDPSEIETLGNAMFALGDVGEDRVQSALDQFVNSAKGGPAVSAEVGEHVSGVVTRALGAARAPAMLERIVPERNQDPLPTLKWLSLDDLKCLAESEHPQLVALLLAHMDPQLAAGVVAGLDEAVQIDLLQRVAMLGPVSAQAFADADAVLAQSIGLGLASAAAGTSDAARVAAILNRTPKTVGTKLLRALAKRDRALAGRIEDDMVVFDDLLALSDKDLGAICRGVEAAELAIALKGVAEAVRERIFATMSARAADTMRDAIAEQGPVRFADVQAAQRAIIAVAKALADSGTIQLGQASDEYV